MIHTSGCCEVLTSSNIHNIVDAGRGDAKESSVENANTDRSPGYEVVRLKSSGGLAKKDGAGESATTSRQLLGVVSGRGVGSVDEIVCGI